MRFHCCDLRRLEILRLNGSANAIDFLEVLDKAAPPGVPRQLGDVVLCPQVVGEAWRAPLVHGLLHLLGYDHGEEMERRERELVPGS